MVKSKRLEQLHTALEAKYLARRAATANLLQREGVLRQDIEKLNNQDREVDANAGDAMHAVGADLIWEAWVGRSKAKLNIQLAQVLAQKEMAQRGVAKEFAKMHAVESLLQKNRRLARKQAAEKALAAAVEHDLRRKR